MEEPLLAPGTQPGFHPNPALFQIPEDGTAEQHDSSFNNEIPSSIKENFVFESPETSPRSGYIWIDYGRSAERMEGEVREQLLLKGGQIFNGAIYNESTGNVDDFKNRETETRLPDHNHVEEWQGWAENPNVRILSMPPQDVRLDAGGESNVIDRGGQTVNKGETDDHSFILNLSEVAVLKSDAKYLLSKHKQLHRSKTAPVLPVMNANREPVLKGPPLESPTSIVSQACIGLVLYLGLGVGIYVWKRREFSGLPTHGFVDALYFCIVTMCTIGYGDITPLTPAAKLFSCAFVLVGFGFIDILLSGMVTYFLDRQEALLLSSLSASHHETAKNYFVDTKKGRMRIRMKVALAFGVVIMCIGVGTLAMYFLEGLALLDAFYLSCMSVTTVGYGDNAFQTLAGRLFASIWLLVTTLAVARAFLYLAEARIDKRHRSIAKWVLQKEMTVGDLVAADLDNDGCVSKSDYVVYKLKEMGKIEEKDVLEICRQFNRLDTDNSGKITTSYLINLHEASATQK